MENKFTFKHTEYDVLVTQLIQWKKRLKTKEYEKNFLG